VEHVLLQQLWQLADAAPPSKGRSRDAIFERLGLILSRPPMHGGYACTPGNTSAFAWTGGDGVHFSLVLRGGRPRDDSPVVMTVPMSMSDRANVIVGCDLRDFLALGVGCGFVGLDQLVYGSESFLRGYPVTAEALGKERSEQLQLLRTTFGVEPWTDPRRRLAELTALEDLLEPPLATPPQRPVPSAANLLQATLDLERGRPADDRNLEREEWIEKRISELGKQPR